MRDPILEDVVWRTANVDPTRGEISLLQLWTVNRRQGPEIASWNENGAAQFTEKVVRQVQTIWNRGRVAGTSDFARRFRSRGAGGYRIGAHVLREGPTQAAGAADPGESASDAAGETRRRRLAAILFADIVDYTKLMARSEQTGLRVRERHTALVRELVQRHGGSYHEERGDETLSTFPSVLAAVRCGLAIQEVVGREPDLRLRVGIHLGEVIFEADGVYGDGVNVASRVRERAEPGRVCVSGEIRDALRNHAELAAEPLRSAKLKNVGRVVSLFHVSSAPDPASYAVSGRGWRVGGRLRPAPAVAAVLSLFLVVLGVGALLAARYLPNGSARRVERRTGHASAATSTRLPASPERPSIAVLPFVDPSGDPGPEYVGDGPSADLAVAIAYVVLDDPRLDVPAPRADAGAPHVVELREQDRALGLAEVARAAAWRGASDTSAPPRHPRRAGAARGGW